MGKHDRRSLAVESAYLEICLIALRKAIVSEPDSSIRDRLTHAAAEVAAVNMITTTRSADLAEADAREAQEA